MFKKIAYLLRVIAYKLDPQSIVHFDKPPALGDTVVIFNDVVLSEDEDYSVRGV